MKKLSKRMGAGLLAVSMTGLLITGCGSAGNTEDTSEDKVTLQFLANETTILTQDFWQTVADRYMEQNPNVTIEMMYQPSSNVSVREYAKTLLATDQFPDVMVMTAPNEFVSSGALMEMTEDDVSMIKDEYVSEIDGGIYVVPYKIQTGGVFYNKDIFEKYNLEVPATYSEFKNICDTLNENGITPCVMGLKDAWAQVVPFSLLQTADLLPDNPNFPKERIDGEVTFSDSAEFKQALSKYYDLLTEYNVSDKNSMTYAQANEYFFNGEAAMYIMGSWMQGEDVATEHDFETGFFPVPTEDGEVVMPLWVNEGLSISSKTQYPDVAKDFVRFFIEDEEWASQFLATEQLFSPCVEEVSYEQTELHNEIEEYMNEGTGIPQFYDTVGDNAWPAGTADLYNKFTLELAMDQNADIDKYVAELDEEFNKVLENVQ